MPLVRDIRLTLELGEVLRRQGIREYSRLKSDMKDLIQELLVIVNNGQLLEPAIAYQTYQIKEVGHDQLLLENDVVLHGSVLSSVLAESRELAVVVCTIGPGLEKQVAGYFNNDEALRGLLLDGIGSAAVDSLGFEVCSIIGNEASLRGYQASSPLSPGGPRFPLSEQWQLFKLAPADQIGVSLTSSGVMVPRKSVSMVIGMGSDMKTWTKAESCARCNLRNTCHYRIHA
jgi:hypothetical protein